MQKPLNPHKSGTNDSVKMIVCFFNIKRAEASTLQLFLYYSPLISLSVGSGLLDFSSSKCKTPSSMV